MQDRFKCRIALHQDKYEEYGLEKFKNQRVFEVKTLNIGYENSTVEIIAEYPNGDWAVREIDDKDIDLMQCTGIKDKNGKLIYEGDVVRFKDNITINGSKTHISVVEHNEAFNAFMYHAECMGLYTVNKAQKERFDIEVLGNIYENPELLED